MPEITDDEYAVLMIAARGESLLPIGRWQGPVERLVAFGYLRALDRFNTVITEIGSDALERHAKTVDTAFHNAAKTVQVARNDYRAAGDDLAQQLASVVKQVASATGEDLLQALRKVSEAVTARAADFLHD